MSTIIDGKALAKKTRENLKIECDELRKKGQELCYNRLKNNFTWEHTTDNLERILEE